MVTGVRTAFNSTGARLWDYPGSRESQKERREALKIPVPAQYEFQYATCSDTAESGGTFHFPQNYKVKFLS